MNEPTPVPGCGLCPSDLPRPAALDAARRGISARTSSMSDAKKRIESFEEFWPFYVKEHAKPKTRRLHFVGTSAVIGLLGAAVLLRKGWPVALAPVAGYGPAWVSHFFVEGNKPASFKYPLWSLVADFKMWGKIATGTMDEEVARILREDADAVAATDTAAPSETAEPAHASAMN